MRYLIDAWLEKGDPHIKIVDVDSGMTRLQWVYHRCSSDADNDHADILPCLGCAALHCLINNLFLLACTSKINTNEQAATPNISQPPRKQDLYKEPSTQAAVILKRKSKTK